MKKILLVLVLAIAISLLLNQIDDDLSKEATDLINRVETDGDSDSYLYLSGIFAEENEAPINSILEEFQRLEIDDSYEVMEYDGSKKIPLPKGDAFCRVWEGDCLAVLFSSEINFEKLPNEYEVLVSRSNKFLEFKEFKEFKTLTKPTIKEQSPPYQYISAAERIKVLIAISTYKNGNPEEAIESLLLQFYKLRKSLALQDNLIGKLVFLMKLSEIIDVSSIILSQEGIKIEMIPSLSRSEKSFHMVAAREFGMSFNTFKNLDKNPEFFEMGGNFPGWVTRMVFKPNMTVNAITPIYYRLEHLAQLSPSDFANEIENGNYFTPSTSTLRNYVGGILIGIASPDFDKYIAMFMDFDAKISIFNHEYSSSSKLQKPYYADSIPKEVNGNICFNGPLEDKRNLRCLRVKI